MWGITNDVELLFWWFLHELDICLYVSFRLSIKSEQDQTNPPGGK